MEEVSGNSWLKVTRQSTYPENTAVKAETLALDVHNVAVFVVGGGSHESGFHEVGVELLGLALNELAGVEALEAVLLKGAQHDALGHLETLDELVQRLVLLGLGSRKLVLGHSQERAVEVVDAVQEILGETLDGELASSVHVTLVALDLVAGLGDLTKVLVLD